MAQVITEQHYTGQPMSMSRPLTQVAVVGLGAGILQWVFAYLINTFLITPIYCQASINAGICINSVGVSGSIAAVVVAVLATGMLVRLRAPQALVITVASLTLLWDSSTWTNGLFWMEGLVWTILLYVLSYLLFSWIGRYEKITPVLIITAIIVFIGRTLLIA